MSMNELTKQETRQVEGWIDMFTNPPKGDEVGFTHKAFGQNCLPYNNPGDDVREYVRKNGNSGLKIEAGSIWDNDLQDFVEIGLPYGGGARLGIIYFITEAKRTKSRRIQLGNSFTHWANKIYGVGKPNGRKYNLDSRQLKRLENQIFRLSACTFTLGVGNENGSKTSRGQMVTDIELWKPQHPNQGVLWQSYVELGEQFFESIQHSSILVDLRAIMHLAGKPMAMDIYTWIAQRLWYIPKGKVQRISWVALKSQFCQSEEQRMADFKKHFRKNLKVALGEYPKARTSVKVTAQGLELKSAPPAIPPQEQNYLLG